MQLGDGDDMITTLLERAVAEGICSGLQAEYGDADGATQRISLGTTAFRRLDKAARRITEDSRFDLASLTKVLATTLVAMRLYQRGVLRLEARIGDILESTIHPELRSATVEDLLRHRSGLVDWLPLFESVPDEWRGTTRGKQRIRELVLARSPERGPRSERYSDLGFIALDEVLESIAGAPLDALFECHVREPLRLTSTGFPPRGEGGRAARVDGAVATEVVPWRGGLVTGEVHDENAWVMGGVSGHAGLFGTASDCGRVARAVLQASRERDTGWLSRRTIARFCDGVPIDGGHHLLGWDTPSGERTSAGDLATRGATIGHLGFTGTSIWLDRAKGAYVVLLTNRVHPSREEPRVPGLRRAFHDAVWALLEQ